jgi:phage host-nuclease inhibitor protein Gam
MAKRIKPDAYIVRDVDGAREALAQLAELDRELGVLEASMNEVIDQAKLRHETEASPIKARKKELEHALQAFGELNKGLFEKKRSMELGVGTIGFRLTSAIQTLSKKINLKMVLEKVLELGLREAIRTTEELDKTVLATWPKERLEKVGLKLETKDKFYIEINRERLTEAA